MAKKKQVQQQQQWRNRIVGYGVKPASWFLANERNWRTHPKPQRDALRGALNEVGWVDDVTVNKRTSEEWPDGERFVETMTDGHARVLEALCLGDDTPVPFKYVDLTPAEEAYVLMTKDPIGAMAAADKAQVDELLRQVQTSDAAVQQMLADVARGAGIYNTGEPNDPYEEWKGMPEFENEDVMGAVATLKVHFANLADIKAFSDLIGQTVNDKTKFIWYPRQEKLNLQGYRVKDES